jgi:hypothetical protein
VSQSCDKFQSGFPDFKYVTAELGVLLPLQGHHSSVATKPTLGNDDRRCERNEDVGLSAAPASFIAALSATLLHSALHKNDTNDCCDQRGTTI